MAVLAVALLLASVIFVIDSSDFESDDSIDSTGYLVVDEFDPQLIFVGGFWQYIGAAVSGFLVGGPVGAAAAVVVTVGATYLGYELLTEYGDDIVDAAGNAWKTITTTTSPTLLEDGEVVITPGSSSDGEDQDKEDLENGGKIILVPGIGEVLKPAEETEPTVTYRTTPQVQYVNNYIYDYVYLYRYTYPDVDIDWDWFTTDGDFSVSYYQEEYFDWGIYFLILFPVLAAEIVIYNRFRHRKAVAA